MNKNPVHAFFPTFARFKSILFAGIFCFFAIGVSILLLYSSGQLFHVSEPLYTLASTIDFSIRQRLRRRDSVTRESITPSDSRVSSNTPITPESTTLEVKEHTIVLPSYITFAAHSSHSSVEMVITDPSGKSIGYDPRYDMHYDEIDNAYYGLEELSEAYSESTQSYLNATIRKPLQGIYHVSVIGTGDGPYTLETFMRFDETKTLPYIQDEIKTGEEHVYVISITDNPQDDGDITLITPNIRK